MHALKSWMKGRHRLLSAGLLSTLLACPMAWAQPPGNGGGFPQDPMMGGQDTGGPLGTSAQSLRPDIIATIGETITLRHPSGKNIDEILVSKGGILGDIKAIDGSPNIWSAKGIAVGVVQVTLVVKGETPAILTIRIDPDVAYIRSLVAKTFPTANVNIIPGSTQGTYIVTGWVESVEDVQPLYNFMRGFSNVGGVTTGRSGADPITMAVRVAGVQQVMLEVCLARVNRGETRSLGVNWQYGDGTTTFGNAFSSQTPAVIKGASGDFTLPGGQELAATLAGNTNMSLGIIGNSSAFLGLIEALRSESLAKILSNPSLTTISGRPADFLVGGELAAVVAGGTSGGDGTGGGGGNIQYREFGTRVSFLPVVLGDGKIRVQVQAEVSRPAGTITSQFFNAPNFETNRVQSTVELEHGQTLVLGGLLENRSVGSTVKVPVLGDLPFVGTAFRRVSFEEQETELLVVVTVSLVDPLDKSQRPKTLPGQETRSPTDFELFVEGILEAPRGCRDPFPCKTYVPAHKLDAPFGCPQGHCNNDKLWNKGCCGACGGSGCNACGGTGCCTTGCTTGCATGCAPGCGTAVPVQGAPVQTAPMPSSTPAPNGTPVNKDGSKSTMMMPSEPKVTIVPAKATAPAAAPTMAPSVVPAIPPLPEKP